MFLIIILIILLLVFLSINVHQKVVTEPMQEHMKENDHIVQEKEQLVFNKINVHNINTLKNGKYEFIVERALKDSLNNFQISDLVNKKDKFTFTILNKKVILDKSYHTDETTTSGKIVHSIYKRDFLYTKKTVLLAYELEIWGGGYLIIYSDMSAHLIKNGCGLLYLEFNDGYIKFLE